jgi:hypothetical protein
MRRVLLSLLAASYALCLGPGCADEERTIKTMPPGYREDVFPQEAASLIDVLWVIDNSASMAPHQQVLAESLTRFMELFSRGLVDYRIAVTTTDVFTEKGAFVGYPPIVHPGLPDPVAAFQRNVRVGTGGIGHEQAFEAARLAIDREKARSAQVLVERALCASHCASQSCRDECLERHRPEFMRPEAHLSLVFVSDEEEQSFGEIRYFQRAFKSALSRIFPVFAIKILYNSNFRQNLLNTRSSSDKNCKGHIRGVSP